MDKVSYFLGLPFAAPPVGNLRFKSPEAVKPWGSKHTYNATYFKAECAQGKLHNTGRYMYVGMACWKIFTIVRDDDRCDK